MYYREELQGDLDSSLKWQQQHRIVLVYYREELRGYLDSSLKWKQQHRIV